MVGETLDAVGTNVVTSGVVEELDPNAPLCCENTSASGDVEMIHWESIESTAIDHVDGIATHVASLGAWMPPWNATEVAASAVQEAQDKLADPCNTSECHTCAEALTLKLCSRHMAGGLPWEQIERRVRKSLRKFHSLSSHDVEELCQEAVAETLVRWDPSRERDWKEPGAAFTTHVAKKLAARRIEHRNREQAAQEGIRVGGSTAARTNSPPGPAPRKPILLKAWFDEAKLTQRERRAFIARIIDGWPVEDAALLLTKKDGLSPQRLRGIWMEFKNRCYSSLKKYLEREDEL